MAGKKPPETNGLHVGRLVKEVLERKRVTHAAIARATHRHQSNIGTLIKKPSTQVYVLWELSLALKHNLFRDIAAQLDAATEGKLQEGVETVESLRSELEALRQERDILLRAVEKLSR